MSYEPKPDYVEDECLLSYRLGYYLGREEGLNLVKKFIKEQEKEQEGKIEKYFRELQGR